MREAIWHGAFDFNLGPVQIVRRLQRFIRLVNCTKSDEAEPALFFDLNF